KAWLRARDQKTFQQYYDLAGDSLKTAPRDYSKDHPMIEDLRRKDFIGLCTLPKETLISDTLLEDFMTRIKAARPLMVFLCESMGISFK
ncbi:MAG: DUF2461 family protein, partial [Planctomycetota bacterium]